MKRTLTLSLLVALGALTACRKEVEKIVVQEVDKRYSWADTPHLWGNTRIILNTGQDGQHLLLQSPVYLGYLSPGMRGVEYYLGYTANLPPRVDVKVPLGAHYVAYPVSDTLVWVRAPTHTTSTNYDDIIRLRQLDPQATTYNATDWSDSPFGAINRNDYLLLGYRRVAGPGEPGVRLLLTSVQPDANDYLRIKPRLLTFPGVTTFDGGNYITHIAAVDDYFLVNLSRNGLYKIREDGTIRRVYPASLNDPLHIASCYKYHGKVYAHDGPKLLVSADDGETWQLYGNMPTYFLFSRFRVVGDSIVGMIPSSQQLFTFQLTTTMARIRELKSDGIGQGTLTGLEQLGDTVYAATTGGLYRRPFSKFFESQP